MPASATGRPWIERCFRPDRRALAPRRLKPHHPRAPVSSLTECRTLRSDIAVARAPLLGAKAPDSRAGLPSQIAATIRLPWHYLPIFCHIEVPQKYGLYGPGPKESTSNLKSPLSLFLSKLVK